MNNKVLIIILVTINLVLLGVCGFFYVNKDRQKPKIEFTAADVLYSEGMDTTELMQGISARDNVDGDISDRIVIEKITVNESANTAVVYYAVCDYSGNVSKASRVFNMDL